MKIEERGSTHVYRQKRMFTKEELAQVEGLCVHEEPAYCNAACPLKLDTKALMKAAGEGDWAKARALYEKITPLPHILAACCDAPCEGKCKLSSLGDAVAIRAVEQAAVSFGEKPRGGLIRFKKKKNVVIFGSGLFPAFLAGELCRKNYPVTVFCREENVEGFLRGRRGLRGAHVTADALAMEKMDITFRFGCNLDREQVETEKAKFHIACFAGDVARELYPGCRVDEAVMVDRSLGIVAGESEGVLDAAFGAKKAALSVDRLAQGLDPANTRGVEGPAETWLYTNTEGVENRKRIQPSGNGYTREEARAEAQRCIQCHCDECVKGCAYLQHYHKYPKVLTREIYNNVSIIMGDHMMNKPINACSLCGQCAVTCPNGYNVAEICHRARENMVFTDKMPLAPHEFALMDMLFSNEEAFLCEPQPGFEDCRYVFFPGCQATAIAPETVKAAYEDLCRRLPGGVGLLLGCCGAICDWAGRYEMYDQTRAFLKSQMEKLGNPMVIAGCPTCKKELSGEKGRKVVGIWDILEEIGLPEEARGLDRPVALHDSCGARGDEQTQNAIRRMLTKLGCIVEETPYSGDRSPCCGYGGLTAYANREVAEEMTDLCLNRSQAPYVSYCMACRDRFARKGRESYHVLELVYGTDAGLPPDISEKRYNRLKLKQGLLRELWGKASEEEALDYEITYTEEALQMMNDRMILKSDVVGVFNALRETGEAIYDGEEDLLITRHRIGNVTFWVKYRETETGYLVCRAYSHRMNILQR